MGYFLSYTYIGCTHGQRVLLGFDGWLCDLGERVPQGALVVEDSVLELAPGGVVSRSDP